MKKRNRLISLDWDMHMRGRDQRDEVPGSDFSNGSSCGTWSDISPRPDVWVLDPTWALLGATGFHP
jgi:hypothetical protein